MDDIAGDAELQEKSHSDLKTLGEQLIKGCEDAMKEFEEKNKNNDASAEGKYLLIETICSYASTSLYLIK